MNDTWTIAEAPEGYRMKTIKRGQYTVQILRPLLRPEEQQRREAHLQAVAERALSKYITRKE